MSIDTQKLRIALAESAGWTDCGYAGSGEERTTPLTYGELCGVNPSLLPQVVYHVLPNYPEDLNAAAELEKRLSENELPHFEYHLRRVMFRDDKDELWVPWRVAATYVWHASALQRCIAYALIKEIEIHEGE